jgi:hypothetical protein
VGMGVAVWVEVGLGGRGPGRAMRGPAWWKRSVRIGRRSAVPPAAEHCRGRCEARKRIPGSGRTGSRNGSLFMDPAVYLICHKIDLSSTSSETSATEGTGDHQAVIERNTPSAVPVGRPRR